MADQFNDDDFVNDADDFGSPQEDDGRTPAAPGSVRASLRDRREAAVSSLHIDLEVPRLDPPVFVRYAPIPKAKINAANEKVAKSKDPETDIIANASLLIGACLGVFEVIDGEEVSIVADDRDGPWPKFDADLARELGVKAGKATAVVRSLYLTDGDVVSTVGKIGEWSGYAAEQSERDTEGN